MNAKKKHKCIGAIENSKLVKVKVFQILKNDENPKLTSISVKHRKGDIIMIPQKLSKKLIFFKKKKIKKFFFKINFIIFLKFI